MTGTDGLRRDGSPYGRRGPQSAQVVKTESVNGTAPSEPTNVIEALARVMAELPSIGKDDKASPQQGGYSYRGIEAITGSAQRLLGKYRVVFVPRVVGRKTIELTVNGKPWTEEQLTIVYTVYGPGGLEDRIEVGPLIALGRDNSDKGTNKAMTQAFKYALLQVLCIGDRASDGDGHDAAEADARSAEQADPDDAFRGLGWKNRAEEGEWRSHFTALGKKLADDDRPAFKEDCAGVGFVWAEPIPKHVADEVDKFFAMYLAPASTPAEAPEPDQDQAALYLQGTDPF